MVRCFHCARDSPETIDPKSGSLSCGVCGKVCCDNIFINDDEVNRYLNTEKEFFYKKMIWESMNKDYLQEQAEKKAYGTLKKSRDKRRPKRAKHANSATQTAAEPTLQMLSKKRLSSKINFDVLDKLFDEDPVVVSNKKRTRVESPNANEAYTKNSNEEEEEEQENGDVEETVDKEEDKEDWYSQNEYSQNDEEENDYSYYHDDGDDEY